MHMTVYNMGRNIMRRGKTTLIKKLSNNIAEILSNGNVIKDTDKDKCSYGIDIMLSSSSEILCILIISIFMRNFIETLLFFIMFAPLRIYAGGYHADSRIRCFAILVGVYAVFSLFIHFENEMLHTAAIYGGMIFTAIMVLIAAPVLHSRKHLTENEIHAFRRFAIIIFFIETTVIAILLLIFGYNRYVLSCECGQLAVSLSMTAACIKKILHRKRGVSQ